MATNTKSFLEPLSSPPNKHTPPSLASTKPSFFASTTRTGSVPVKSGFNKPIPANVINFVPKSDRESTLRIFKAKQYDDRIFGERGDEPFVKKGNAYLDSIRKGDTPLTIDFLVDKGKKDYAKKNNHKITGSMYVNDLWARHYDVKVRRKAKIDSELKNLEFQKRKPLHLKLDDAVGYFEQKMVNSARASEAPKLFNLKLRENPVLLTEIGQRCESERDWKPERHFVTEAREDNMEDFEGEKSPRLTLMLPNIKGMDKSHTSRIERADTTMCTSASASGKRPSRDKMLFDYQNKKHGLMLTEASEARVKGLHFELEILEDNKDTQDNKDKGCLSERAGYMTQTVKESHHRRFKSIFAATKGAFDDFLSQCDTDIKEVKEITGSIQGAKDVWLKEIFDKQKRREKMKKEQIFEECTEAIKKRRAGHKKGLSM